MFFLELDCDSGILDHRKSITGFVFFLGDTTFTWSSKKQPIVALSTCEAEYVDATSCNLAKEFDDGFELSTKGSNEDLG